MPFLNIQTRPFIKQNIEALRVDRIGVYTLFKPGQWIYVGKGDIRQRLLNHLNGDNPCITRMRPTSWVAEVTHSDPSVRERQIILGLSPYCNKQVG